MRMRMRDENGNVRLFLVCLVVSTVKREDAGKRTAAHGPHFLVPGAWSSKWMPAAPASMNILVSFMTAVRPPWPVSPSATIGVR